MFGIHVRHLHPRHPRCACFRIRKQEAGSPENDDVGQRTDPRRGWLSLTEPRHRIISLALGGTVYRFENDDGWKAKGSLRGKKCPMPTVSLWSCCRWCTFSTSRWRSTIRNRRDRTSSRSFFFEATGGDLIFGTANCMPLMVVFFHLQAPQERFTLQPPKIKSIERSTAPETPGSWSSDASHTEITTLRGSRCGISHSVGVVWILTKKQTRDRSIALYIYITYICFILMVDETRHCPTNSLFR
jgi:hypothetical protein